MEVDSADENTNRWGKSSIHSDENQAPQSRSLSPTSTKKKKKSSKSKKKKKHKRSKSKKKKSEKKKSGENDDRWRPNTDSDSPSKTLTPSPKSSVSPTNTKQKIQMTFNKPLHANPSSPARQSPLKSRSKSPADSKSTAKRAHQSPKSASRSPKHSSSRSISRSMRSRTRSRSRSRSPSFDRSRSNGRKRRYNDHERRYNDSYNPRSRERPKPGRDHFTDSPPQRSYYAAKHRYRSKGRERQINHKVIAALNEIQEKHKDDNTHPLDLKQQELKRNCARRKDKAMIWAAASGNFDTEIIKSPLFQKNISLALKTTNKDFDIAVLFKQFSNFSVKLVWLDCSDRASGIKKSELLTFRDLMSIRSYRKELNHCDALWKFIFYDQRHLFWSMAIYYALLNTTLVPEWDDMFKKQFDLIQKYGKTDYIEKDIELLEEDKHRSRSRSDSK